MNQQPTNAPTILTASGWTLAEDFEPGFVSGSWGCDDTRLNRTYTVKVIASVDSRFAGPIGAIGALRDNGFPIGSTYRFPLFVAAATETDTGSFLTSIDVATAAIGNGQGTMWELTLNFTPFDVYHQLGQSSIHDGLVNPLDRASEVYWSNAKYEIYKPLDNGQTPIPYLNTAGDPLIDPPALEETRPTLKFVRNESTYNDDYASTFKDTVNNDVFLGYPPNTAKCADISGERVYDPDWGYFFRVTYQFEFRDTTDGNGYSRQTNSVGYRQLPGGSGSPTNILDPNGKQITDAVPLQKDGSYQPGKDPYIITFVDFASVDFADLNIPDDVLFALN